MTTVLLSILQHISEKGKAFVSLFMLITHSDILYYNLLFHTLFKGGEGEEPQKLKTTPLKLADDQSHDNSTLC